jgi:hypothetical protein
MRCNSDGVGCGGEQGAAVRPGRRRLARWQNAATPKAWLRYVPEKWCEDLNPGITSSRSEFYGVLRECFAISGPEFG